MSAGLAQHAVNVIKGESKLQSMEDIAKAYEVALKDPGFTATDDCGTVLRYLPDEKVGIVRGSERNIKLTYADDLPLLEFLLSTPEP